MSTTTTDKSIADDMATGCSNDGYVVLVEFAHKHLDFQMPELLSVLEMNHVKVIMDMKKSEDSEESTNTDTTRTCRVLPLPNEERYRQETKAAFRRAFVLLEFDPSWYTNTYTNQPPTNQAEENSPQSQNIPNNSSKDIGSILSRCTLVRRVIELWGKGTTISETAQNTKQWIQLQSTASSPASSLGKTIDNNIRDPATQSWKISIHTIGAKYTREEHQEMRSAFSYFLDFPGKVQMKEPNHEFLLIREMELDSTGSPVYPRYGQEGKSQLSIIPENDQRDPLACYFGRILWVRDKRSLEKFDLKNRAYLGPTSMDAELSFVMANLGHVQPGTVVLDPFVGTGSILVSCALRGGFCVGTDIDIRVLRGRDKDENIYSNFEQFQLPRPELIRSDNAIFHRHFRFSEPWVDTIITDPPYGIRAGARKSGSRLEQPRAILEENRHDHIAQTKPYNVADVMADLLDVAARVLVMGGRLVYVIPSFATDFTPSDDLPHHDCLEVLHLSFQPFTMELGRRMVTMKKVRAYDPKLRDAYLSKTWKNGASSAQKCADIREKILEAAKQKPGYEEKLRIRKQKRKETKVAKKEAKKKAKLEHEQQQKTED